MGRFAAQLGAALNSSAREGDPLASTAHTVRASLLANAATTTLYGRLASKRSTHADFWPLALPQASMATKLVG